MTITFFNSIAEQFIGESANVLKNNKDNTDILYDKVLKRIYKLTVSGGRKEDEYNCLDFQFMRNTKEDISHSRNGKRQREEKTKEEEDVQLLFHERKRVSESEK